ncbi:MAG: GatB/YqeY domain-containing protein [Candidatus Woesebacteria bacterium]|nr:GatB/YqeY domain-containing protein [Candidatus Woesebacteria bacterium]
MIVPSLIQKIGDAMKAHDTVRVSTLRMLLSELKNEKINTQHELTNEEELKVVRREAKKRKEAIEMYTKANAKGRVENEKAELAILSEFLPAEVTEEEMNKLIDDSIVQLSAKDLSSMGKVIADVKSKNSGVDGGVVANIVRQKLS